MSGRTLVSALVLVLLAAPSAAVGKGVQDAQVCGADGCVAAPLNADTYLVFEGGPIAPAPREREPFYELRFRVMEEHGVGADPDLIPVRTLFLPASGRLRGEDGTWMQADARAGEAMRRHLAGIEPFPAAKLDLPGVPDTTEAPAPSGGDGPPLLLLLTALALLAAGAAAAIGSRRRRRPAAG